MKHVKAMQCLSATLMTRNEENGCGVNDAIKGKIPCVTKGKELRYHPMSHSWERITLPSHESLMGKNYVFCTLGYSWGRIMCFHCT